MVYKDIRNFGQYKRRLTCRIIGHDWRYNFKTLPSKRICKTCRQRQHWDGDPYTDFVDGFKYPDSRTDKELIEKWIK